jgi:hypothetical protein
MTTSEAQLRSYNPQSGSSEPNYSWFEELAVQDLSWVVNTQPRYASMLHKIPDIFAWEEARDHLANLQILARSVALRRFLSSVDHIGRYDQNLARSMRTTFEELPLEGKIRFITAPETFHRITRLRKEPVDSIVSLCNFLNGEAALHGLGQIDKDYVTALGDFYYAEDAPEAATAAGGKEANATSKTVSSPLFAGSIPIDFASSNAANAQESDDKREYIQYSEEEKALVCERLNETFRRIERVSEATAYLIKQRVKVIIPLKRADGGSGSTSQPRYPGRILLRGVEICSYGALASGLVHESMHQVLYILEWVGPFIVEDPDMRAVEIKSAWTGRDLPLHSFIHACFIWYGLSTFWALARSTDAFEPADIGRQLKRSLSGFREQNPIEHLAPYAGMLRYDVLKVAGMLRDRLQSVLSDTEGEA